MALSGVASFFLLCLSILAFQATSSKVYNMGNDQTLFSPRATSSKVYNMGNDQTLFSPRATKSKVYNMENDQTLFSPRATSSKMYNMGNDQTLFSPRNDQTLFSPRATDVEPSNPNFNLFIRMDDFKLGGKMAVYFPVPDDAPLLSKEEAEKLPLHNSKLSEALEYFGFQEGSKEAKAVEKSMAQCQPSSTKGEVKFCAATLDSLLESAKPFFGQLDDVMATTTKIVPTDFSNLLQNYTVVEEPKVVSAHKMMGCHVLQYPNLLYFCHGQESENKLLKASLVGENGWKVEAVGICHMDTSEWSPEHPVFEKMHTSPGKGPLCHFFPAQNLIFFPSTINLE